MLKCCWRSLFPHPTSLLHLCLCLWSVICLNLLGILSLSHVPVYGLCRDLDWARNNIHPWVSPLPQKVPNCVGWAWLAIIVLWFAVVTIVVVLFVAGAAPVVTVTPVVVGILVVVMVTAFSLHVIGGPLWRPLP